MTMANLQLTGSQQQQQHMFMSAVECILYLPPQRTPPEHKLASSKTTDPPSQGSALEHDILALQPAVSRSLLDATPRRHEFFA